MLLPHHRARQLNGQLFKGDVEELLKTLHGLLDPLVVGDETLMRTVSQLGPQSRRFPDGAHVSLDLYI